MAQGRWRDGHVGGGLRGRHGRVAGAAAAWASLHHQTAEGSEGTLLGGRLGQRIAHGVTVQPEHPGGI